MQKCALVITTSAFILACGALAASAQQTGGPMTQQREGSERQIEGAQTPRRAIEGDRDRDNDRYGGGMMAGVTGLVGDTIRTGAQEPWAPT